MQPANEFNEKEERNTLNKEQVGRPRWTANFCAKISANVVFNDRRQNRGRHPGGSHSSSQIGPVKELMACFHRELRSGVVRLGVIR